IGRDVVLSTWCGRRHQQIRWRTLNVTFVVPQNCRTFQNFTSSHSSRNSGPKHSITSNL
uniref:Ovule protein n=1 Tax=Loa loa TaxID=7209 RepID=A0A1I7VJ63_LOALO